MKNRKKENRSCKYNINYKQRFYKLNLYNKKSEP